MPRSLVLLLVLVVGVLLAVQPAINSQLSRHTGSLGAAFVSLAGSALAIGIVLVASGNAGGLSGAGDVSPIYLTGGLMGAFNVTVALFAISRIGAGGVVAASITSQLIVAAVLDHFGLLGLRQTSLTPATAFGFVLLIAGVVLVTAR
jgi:bacterial/archaeal transporter family-2 protein